MATSSSESDPKRSKSSSSFLSAALSPLISLEPVDGAGKLKRQI